MHISLDEVAIQPGKYRVVLHTGDSADFEAFLDFAQRSSTISRTDAIAVADRMAEWIVLRAAEGKEVNLGPLGRSRLGMRGTFDSRPDRIDDKDVRLTISWILPGKLKKRVAKAGDKLVRQRVMPKPKSPVVTEVRRILAGAALDEVPARYEAGRGLRLDGYRLDYDPANDDEGVFLIDDQQTARRITDVVTILPGKILLLMPADASGNYTLEVRRRHPKSTGRLLRGRYEKPLVPVES